MALNTAKASSVALMNAAQGSLDKGKYVEAESYLLEVLRRDMNDAAALALMAEVAVGKRLPYEALICITSAINAAPNEMRYKERLIELGSGGIATYAHSGPAEQAIVECLKSGDMLDCTRIHALWISHLFCIPSFQNAFGLNGRKAFDPENKAHFENLPDLKPLFNPFFLLGIKHIVASNAVFEEFITHIRRHLFKDVLLEKNKFTDEERPALASALSHYAFHTDYILDCTEEEQKEIDVLQARIEGGTEIDPIKIALFACYVPLYKLKNAEHIALSLSSSPDITDVIKKQILDYSALKNVAKGITAITPIDDTTSVQVREQYEEFPYPQWKRLSQESMRQGWKSRNSKFTKTLDDRKIDILNAGCGTGQEPALLLTVFPKANILAVDLSRTSIAYAISKAGEYGLRNITFRQADILRLGMLDQKFDHISSCGVLHHMKDPVKGWKIFYDILKPGGTMMIGLYSKLARDSVLKMREIIKQRGYGSDAAEMKRFRRESQHFLEEKALLELSRWRDYYFMPMYRDLLFHVQETDYDLTEIEMILKELKLDFLGFSLRQSVLNDYTKQYPDDPDMNNLKNWHQFEEKSPQTFREMYYLWCRKPAALL